MIMIKQRKRSLVFVAIVAAFAFICLMLWNQWGAATKIALINFQPFLTTDIAKSNHDSHIKYKEVDVADLKKATKCDFVLLFGMGLQLTAEQRLQIEKM
ncbi:MAG: hypothetical protein LBV46_01415, partial [Bacteroidales bacterium]|nr:hypothetical protein [Bacteroidales bacterium]